MKELDRKYFHWLCKEVTSKYYIDISRYTQLLEKLFYTDFTVMIDLDNNRAADGINLRYYFGDIYGIEQPKIASVLDIRPCSVLEMMVALCTRYEQHIMYDPDIGDRTSLWFCEMIRTLGLYWMDNDNYDEKKVDDILERFLDHKYSPDGKGGLFFIPYRTDMQKIDIWYQADLWYSYNFK